MTLVCDESLLKTAQQISPSFDYKTCGFFRPYDSENLSDFLHPSFYCEATLQRLKTSMLEHGFIKKFPIVIDYSDKQFYVVDGGHRLLVCRMLNIEPAFVLLKEVSKLNANDFYTVANLMRHHPKKMVYANEMLAHYEGPNDNQKMIAYLKESGVGHSTAKLAVYSRNTYPI